MQRGALGARPLIGINDRDRYVGSSSSVCSICMEGVQGCVDSRLYNGLLIDVNLNNQQLVEGTIIQIVG